MKNLLLIIYFLSISCFGYSQSHTVFDKGLKAISLEMTNHLTDKNKKKVVVLNIVDKYNVQTNIGKYMANTISDYIVGVNSVVVFDKGNLASIIDGKTLINEGWVDKNRQQFVMLDIDVFIVGSYTLFSNSIDLSLKALDSRTGAVVISIKKNILLTKEMVKFFPELKSDSASLEKGSTGSDQVNDVVNRDCEINNTGDYCFTNNSKLYVDINISSKVGNREDRKLTLSPGQTQCFYNMKVGNWKYNAFFKKQSESYSGVKSEEGELKIERCKSKKLIFAY